jgi:hypothetical protein
MAGLASPATQNKHQTAVMMFGYSNSRIPLVNIRALDPNCMVTFTRGSLKIRACTMPCEAARAPGES